jgi:hypothetical protein
MCKARKEMWKRIEKSCSMNQLMGPCGPCSYCDIPTRIMVKFGYIKLAEEHIQEGEWDERRNI